ncbi:MAG: aa3-type cytochrome c oxidase subunit IV [Hyphomicrobiaceae bacterium]
MSIDTTGGHPAMDYREHERTYRGFVRGTIVLTILVALILIGMAIFLL